VSREIAGNPVLSAGHFPLLALHRHVPEHGITDLIRQSQQVGSPVRLSFFHFTQCRTCTRKALVGDGALCAKGQRLVAASAGWRPRP
jgi:hypothetical protein